MPKQSLTPACAALRERARGRLAELRDDLTGKRPTLYPMGVALIWSVLLLLPLHLFRANQPYFDGLKHYGPEWKWGLITLSVVCVQALTYLLGVYWQRAIAESIAFYVWATVSALMSGPVRHWHGMPLSFGPYLYGLFAAGCGYVVGWQARYAIVDWLAAMRRRDHCQGEDAMTEEPTGEEPTGEEPTGEEPIGKEPIGKESRSATGAGH